MSETWFTSDHHFGHTNILKYEPYARPFETVTEMAEVMIDCWNKVVDPKDCVYHLGDFAFGKRWISIAERLNGRKKLVMGNHDSYPAAEYLNYFDKLYGVVFWENCILSHVPVHQNGLGQRWKLNVHGHLHSKKVMATSPEGCIYENRNYFNVSVEQNDLTPFHRDEIMARMKELD